MCSCLYKQETNPIMIDTWVQNQLAYLIISRISNIRNSWIQHLEYYCSWIQHLKYYSFSNIKIWNLISNIYLLAMCSCLYKQKINPMMGVYANQLYIKTLEILGFNIWNFVIICLVMCIYNIFNIGIHISYDIYHN